MDAQGQGKDFFKAGSDVPAYPNWRKGLAWGLVCFAMSFAFLFVVFRPPDSASGLQPLPAFVQVERCLPPALIGLVCGTLVMAFYPTRHRRRSTMRKSMMAIVGTNPNATFQFADLFVLQTLWFFWICLNVSFGVGAEYLCYGSPVASILMTTILFGAGESAAAKLAGYYLTAIFSLGLVLLVCFTSA